MKTWEPGLVEIARNAAIVKIVNSQKGRKGRRQLTNLAADNRICHSLCEAHKLWQPRFRLKPTLDGKRIRYRMVEALFPAAVLV